MNLLLYKIDYLQNATEEAFRQDLNKIVNASFVLKFILIF